jgi:TonB family protein
MPHGSHDYFLEVARFSRRLALVTVLVSLGVLGGETALVLPRLRAGLRTNSGSNPLERLAQDLKRFGFEGRDQYVRRITLETSGPPGPNPGRPTIVYRSLYAVKGGRDARAKSSDDPHAKPDTRRLGSGAGESSTDLVALARVIYGGSAPVVRSEDLVIEDLVRPDYPEAARDANIEGLVALAALVDTTGHVARVDLLSSTGHALLEEAAMRAVRRCVFRPYRVGGQTTEVRAVFRFNFRIYD